MQTTAHAAAGLDTRTRRTFVNSITSIIVIIVLSSPQWNGKYRDSGVDMWPQCMYCIKFKRFYAMICLSLHPRYR